MAISSCGTSRYTWSPGARTSSGAGVSSSPDLPPAWLVLVNPNKPLATKAVFGALNGRTSAPQSETLYRGLPTAADLGRVLSGGRNDLAAPAGEVMGEISDMLRSRWGAYRPGG